ncbi:MAG: SIR2 family protein [Desulfobacterales bacterium]
MNSKTTWLHLSDLHLRSGDQYNQNIAIESLLHDLMQLVDQEDYRFDLIFITGDIAFSGNSEEYVIANKFIRNLSSATAVPTNRIFCVPGNHDVDRKRITPFVTASLKNLNTRDSVSQVIGNKKERSLFTDRCFPYSDFLKATFPWAKELNYSDLSYTHIIDINGAKFAIVGLNSAWLAGSDSDHGSIIIGERQVREAIDKAHNPDFILALVHHPLSSLTEFDLSDVRAILNSRCDFLLHGHVHNFGVVNVVSPDSEVFHLAAGATYQGRNELLSYNIVSLDLDEGIADVAMRRYSDREGGFWAPDTSMYRAAPNGILSLTLPERISKRSNPPNLSALNERLSELVSETVESTTIPEPIPAVPRPPAALIKEIRDGRCVLFAGAGASVDANLPGWVELLRGMIDRVVDAGTLAETERDELAHLLETGEYLVVAAFCRDRLGLYDFAQYLQERLSDLNRISRTHRILAEIPFRAAITTNFDSYIENLRDRAQVVLPEMMERMGAAGAESILNNKSVFPVIKIHGSAVDVESIVLTRGDFRKILFSKPKYKEFLRRLFIDSTILFYGYGFKDPNVDFILQELMSDYGGNARPHYAILPEIGNIASKYWFDDSNIRVVTYQIWNGSHAVATSLLQEISAQCK